MECAKVSPSGCGVRKVNKKQVKDEMERMKQAEKKKRRLGKALAMSAAIRSELEKKKQNIKEQQRLDEVVHKMECAKVVPSGFGVRKVNKKQVNDEMERMKQAEKKKRRLEKALAMSAAIRSELEKKKQNVKEQQRLDEVVLKMECVKVVPSGCGVRKANKKQVKDEMERMKQAEKKKRRLEKALATSAAIRSELEEKKQKKKEQQRLDEEGAALAEAVALHVLLGEDSEDEDGVILKDKRIIDPWDNSGKIDILLGGQRDKDLSKYPFEGAAAGSASGNLRYGCMWSHWRFNTDWIVSPQSLGRDSVESHYPYPCSNY